MTQKDPLKITSFNPAILLDWVLCVSVDNETQGILILLFHRFDHVLRCGYVVGQDAAINFIESIIESK